MYAVKPARGLRGIGDLHSMRTSGKFEPSYYYDFLCYNPWMLTAQGRDDCRWYEEAKSLREPTSTGGVRYPAPPAPTLRPVPPIVTTGPAAGNVQCLPGEPADVCARRTIDDLNRQQADETRQRWLEFFGSLDESNKIAACNERGGRYEDGQCIFPPSPFTGLMWIVGGIAGFVVLKSVMGGR